MSCISQFCAAEELESQIDRLTPFMLRAFRAMPHARRSKPESRFFRAILEFFGFLFLHSRHSWLKNSLLASAVLSCCVSLAPAADAPGQGIESKTFTVTARACESPLLKYRLFPAEYELKEGNAAPILLRLVWGQQPFMNQVVPQLHDMLEIPLADADRIRAAAKMLSFDHFLTEMRRAAYRRHANWEYPLTEAPAAGIRLPDLQGSRDFGRALAVWIRQQIVDDNVEEAREGILVGLSTARHYARTPFLIHQLVGYGHANFMAERLFELLQHPQCPNLYWAITVLPSPFLNVRQACEFERDVPRRSVDGLSDLDRPRSPEQWQELADRLIRFFVEGAELKTNSPPDEVAEKRRLLPKWARHELARIEPALMRRSVEMSDGEATVRWLAALHSSYADRAATAAALGTRDAIEQLRVEADHMAAIEQRWAVSGGFLTDAAFSAVMGSNRFERRMAALRVIEAARSYAAAHGGNVPERLDELTENPAPNDPFTGQPFGYERAPNKTEFTLSAPPAQRLKADDHWQFGIDWHVKVSQP